MRYKEEKRVFSNAQMPPKLIRKFCAISEDGERLNIGAYRTPSDYGFTFMVLHDVQAI